jgi:hypothetical protein
LELWHAALHYGRRGRPFLATVNAADLQREEFVIKVSL